MTTEWGSEGLIVALKVWIVPFAAFYLGIVIRKVALPGKSSPPLTQQLLLGIPVSLVLVSPLLVAFRELIESNSTGWLFVVGTLMEHGMLVTETAAQHLERLRDQQGSPVPALVQDGP